MEKFSVIIPQHGRSDLTLKAATSLQEHHRNIEIIIVDDGSSVGECRRLQSQLRGNILLIRLSNRCGVTAAWNRGAMHACGDHLIFLNNDTVTNGEWLPALIAPLQSKEALITSPQSRDSAEISNSIVVPQWNRQLLAGWCLAMCRDTFTRFRGFDEQLQLYFSDTDLQLRVLHQCSSGLISVEDLPLKHLGHRTTRHLPQRSREWRRDREMFFRKWTTKGNG